MSPGDIYFWRDEEFGCHRFYEITGVFLGAEGHTGLVEIKPLNEKPGSAYGQRTADTLLVPEPLLRNVPCYTPDIRP